jgi:hypothetical protein
MVLRKRVFESNHFYAWMAMDGLELCLLGIHIGIKQCFAFYLIFQFGARSDFGSIKEY